MLKYRLQLPNESLEDYIENVVNPAGEAFERKRIASAKRKQEKDEKFKITVLKNSKASEASRTKDADFSYHYFITIAFPTNQKYSVKHLQLSAGYNKIVFTPIKYGDLTHKEQYEWICWKLRKNIQLIASRYDIFFEQTKIGNIHMHGRIYSEDKMYIKDVRAMIHRMFETDTKYVNFVDIKPYDSTKWNDYQNKREHKQYQTLNYPNFTNNL